MKVPAPTGKVHLLEPSMPSSKGSLMMEEKDGDRSAAAAALQSIRWGQSSEGSNSSGDDPHTMSTSDIISLYSKNSSSNNYPGLRSIESLPYSDYAPVYDLLRESHLSSSATTLAFHRSRFSSSDEDCRLAEVNPVSHDIFATANRRNGENSPSSQSCNQFLQPMPPPIFPLEPKDDPPPSDAESGVPPCGHNRALRYPRGNGNVKLLCSFGGKILPRPGDGKLRYVGGETRIISVPVNISYAEFTRRLTESYGTALFLKYQLPDEELDALISVSSDDDLQNMMEECCKIEYSGVGGGGGAIRSPLRIFPFPQDSERSDHLEEIFTCRNPEQSYIYAINGISDRFLMESVENGNEQWGDEVLLGFDPSIHSNNQAEGSAIGCSQDSMRVVVPPNPHLGGWIKSGNTPLATPSSTPSSPPLAQRPIMHAQQGDLNMHPSMERLGHRAGIHNYGDGHLQRFEDRDHSSHLSDTLKYSDLPPIELAVSRSGQRRLFGEPPVPNQPVQQRCYSPSHTQRPDNSHHFWSQHQIGGGDRHPSIAFQEVRQRQDVPRQYLVDMYAPREFPRRLHHFQADQHSVEPDDYLGSSYLPTSMCLQGFASTPPHLIEIAQPSSPRQQQQQPSPGLVESKYVPIQQQHMLRGEPLHSSRGGGSQAIRSRLPNSPPFYHVEPNYVDGGGGRATPKHLPEPLAVVNTPKYSFYNAVPELDAPGTENFQSASTMFHLRGTEKDRQALGQQTGPFSQTNQRSTLAHHEQQQRRQFPEQTRFNNQDRLEQYDVGTSRSHRMYRHNRETVEDGIDMVSGFSQTHEKGSDESLQLMQAREVDVLRYQKMNRTEVAQNDRYPDQSMRMPAQQALVNSSHSRSQQRVFGRYTGKAEMQGEADLYNSHMQAASELPSTVGVVDIWGGREGTHLLDMHEQDKHLDYSERLFNGLPLPPLDLIEVNSDSRFTESKALSNAFPSAMTTEAPNNELESGQVPSYINPPATFSSTICPWDCKSSKSSLVVAQDNDTNPLALPIYDQSPISSVRASPSRDFPLIHVDLEKNIHENTAKDASAIEMSFIGCLAEDMATRVLDSCSKDPVLEVDAIIKDASIESPDELLMDNSIKKEEDGNSQCRFEPGDASSACIAVGGGEGAKQGSLNIQSPLASKKLQQQPEDDNSAWEKALPADLNSSGEKKTQKSPLASKKLQQQPEDDNSAWEKALPADLNSSGEKKTQKIDIGNDNPIDGDEKCSKNATPGALPEALSLQTIKNADLEEVRELGSGTFGTVFYGKWRGSDVAIKRIKSSCFSGRPSEQERLITDFWKEACTLGQLHHPNIVAFYGVVSDEPGGTLATVTEYMVNGSLKQVLQKKDRTIDRRKRLLIAMDAAFGMEYLHSKNIVHFDLKSENLLVNMRDPHRPICKVGDFGLSKVKHHTLVSGGVRGTLPWMAPELLSGKSSKVTEKIDVYSFGIVMWELLTGEEPYADMHCGEIIGGIVSNTLRPPIPTWCDPAWRSLMQRCWVADPKERPSFAEAVSELRAIASSMNLK